MVVVYRAFCSAWKDMTHFSYNLYFNHWFNVFLLFNFQFIDLVVRMDLFIYFANTPDWKTMVYICFLVLFLTLSSCTVIIFIEKSSTESVAPAEGHLLSHSIKNYNNVGSGVTAVVCFIGPCGKLWRQQIENIKCEQTTIFLVLFFKISKHTVTQIDRCDSFK